MEEHPFQVKWYLNGFPKSGLHLVSLMLQPVARRMPQEDVWKRPWTGTFARNSWSDEWMPLEQILFKASRVRSGHYLKTHTGYKPEIEQFLYYLGVSHIFIYRDPRDIAVSQAHHVISDDDMRFVHPGKELYRAMGNFDDVLSAVIVGLDGYPGVMHRWQYYAPWLDVDWVYKVRFEDLRRKPRECADAILRYGLQRTAGIFNQTLTIVEDAFKAVVEAMVTRSGQTEDSPTFRRGNMGDWRGEFSGKHRQLFKETDTDSWLVRLGYEEDDDW